MSRRWRTSVWRSQVWLATLLALLAISSVASGANRVDPQVRFSAEDQKLARGAVLSKSDLGPGWKGGLVKVGKADFTALPCPGYTQSDLVVTGAAGSSLDWQGAITVATGVEVFETKEMVQLDLRRLSP